MTIDELKRMIKDYPGNFEVKFKTINGDNIKEVVFEDIGFDDKNAISILVNEER